MNLINYGFLVILVTLNYSSAHKIDANLHRERESDGAFGNRADNHYKDGQHHTNFDHEAIIGSAKQAEEYDHLPPKEAKKLLQVLLEKMDLNDDKFINTREMHDWILRSFAMLSKEESKERFDDADEDNDGYVTWAEHLKETYGVNDPSGIDLSAYDGDETTRMMKEDKDLFEGADADSDGKLSEEEFVAFSHPEEDEKMIPIIIEHTMAAKDEDKDGLLSFSEYVQGILKEEDNNDETLLMEKERFDEEYDKNMDGVLDKVEIKHWLIPDNQEIAASEVKHLFASADDSEDGVLSFDEILDHHDVFVGSEVTDYGEHLHNMHLFNDEL